MQFFVEPIWSWSLVILISVGLVVLVVLTYRAQLKRVRPPVAKALLTLRLMAVAVLIFAMFRPAIQKSDTDENPVQLFVLADVSRSMNTADMPGGVTRFNAVRSDLAKYESKWKELGKSVSVTQYDFAQDLKEPDLTLAEGNGEQTAFGKTLESVLEKARDHRSLGVILLTDGAQRAVAPYDADPFTAARKLGDNQIPIYAVGYGASSLANASLDVAIEDLRVDPIVFEKKLVPVTCKLRAVGANGKKVRVLILIENRSGKQMGQTGELKPAPSTQQAKTVREIEIKQDVETMTLDLSFVPMSAGELKIAVKAEALEGELLTRNNQRETILTVKKGGLNVAYFDQARPEQRVLRMVNGADKIQLDYQEVLSGRFASHTRLDPNWFDRGRYDVYIIGDVRADWFGTDVLKKLADRLEENGAGLLMIGGLQNFSAGGYATTAIADYLPVRMDASEYRPPGQLNLNVQLTGDVKLIPTDRGLQEFVMQLGPGDKNRSLWLDLPPLAGANRLKISHELVRVWAKTPDDNPLLMAHEVGRSRVAAFAADTTWLWCQAGKTDLHQRFWRQMILWLARKEADTDQPVWVKVEPRNYTPGARASLTFGARAADATALHNAEFQLDVTKPDGKGEKPTPQAMNDEHSAEFTDTSEPGDYWVRVAAKQTGNTVGYAYTRFIVDARDLELDYPSADYDFLKELSSMSGGTSLKPEEIGSLLERLKQTRFNALTRIQVISLWDNWWLLAVFVGLMTMEWFLRKKSGLV